MAYLPVKDCQKARKPVDKRGFSLSISLINSDSLAIPLAAESVHMIATSPPYWGLRDYGLGGEGLGLEPLHDCLGWARGENCGRCYLCRMRLFAAECWRVLRDDGVMWLNLGDSYSNSPKGSIKTDNSTLTGSRQYQAEGTPAKLFDKSNIPGLKPKDLVGIPWRVALALQADGWYLRSDIIWAKPNPMPESVTDRPTKAHEYVFLLAKSKRYFYDADAVRERGITHTYRPDHIARNINGTANEPTRTSRGYPGANDRQRSTGFINDADPNGRNKRTVWNIATAPYPGAHFACFPPALVEPMIKAGTSERGCCPECGAQWERVTEKGEFVPMRWKPGHDKHDEGLITGPKSDSSAMVRGGVNERITTGWRPTCDHDAAPVPCIVLDPFAGSGTTGVVSRELGRDAVLLDLSFDYLSQQAKTRLELNRLEQWESGVQVAQSDDLTGLPLFEGFHD